MEIMTDLSSWLKGAIAVIGLIQMAKNFITIKPKYWAVLLVPMSIGFAFLPQFAQDGLGIAALAQIGYETIIQSVQNALKPKN